MADKEQKPAKKKNIHAGHRRRMWERFRATGFNGFHDHEALEMLLYTAIPRRDTNPTAHELMNRFKTLNNVLDADEETLMTVPGIGPRAAEQIHFVSIFTERVLLSRMSHHRRFVRNKEDVRRIMLPMFSGQISPRFFLMLMDGAKSLIEVKMLESTEFPETRDIMLPIAHTRAEYAVLVEYSDAPVFAHYEERLPKVQQLALAVERTNIAHFFDAFLWDEEAQDLLSFRALKAFPACVLPYRA